MDWLLSIIPGWQSLTSEFNRLVNEDAYLGLPPSPSVVGEKEKKREGARERRRQGEKGEKKKGRESMVGGGHKEKEESVKEI